MESDSQGPPHSLRALFVAVDGGPREALAPVSAYLSLPLSDTDSSAAETQAHWQSVIAREKPQVLVTGTSDSARGRRIESAARRAANPAAIPVAAIEDFPGNYDDVSNGAASLVIVESAAARDICVRKHASAASRVEVVPSPRYDRYREERSALRAKTRAGLRDDRARVLWAGQPESDDCLRTLEAVLPVLRTHAVEFLFKAHPRDPGYTSGEYRALIDTAGVHHRDITEWSVEAALETAPHLVITQFSSVAIDAGFYGIPSLWILLSGAGGDRLKEKKGYAVPPVCHAGGAAYVTDRAALDALFGRVLETNAFRMNLIDRFDDYFKVRERGTPNVVSKLMHLK